ncbi:MAG TPA: PQQ-binding-like beta-propeller repeat protein [Polyangiaceae bacterium]|nr:PQQ-binding-like beta-propeller repeat protein [Polyangiaceae bacterium]
MKPLQAMAALAFAAVACGGAQPRLTLFSTNWQDDRGTSIARVWETLERVPIPAAADVIVGVTERGDALIGLPISGERASRWTVSHALDARPVVAGDVVVGSGGGEIFAVDAATGRMVWRCPSGGLPLVGAGDDGSITVATFEQAGGLGSVLLAVRHDGEILRRIETDKALGAPAVVGHLAFVPWAGQYVSVIDLASGNETARVTLRQQMSHAWTQAQSLWFGQLGFTRFDQRISLASSGGATMTTVLSSDLPGTPTLMPPGVTPLPAAANAGDKVRLYARPAATDAGVTMSDGRFYATYFRVAMGFEVSGTKIDWVHVHAADFLGGAAGVGAVVLCDEQGKAVALDGKSGGILAEMDLGQPLRACVVNVDAAREGVGTPVVKPLAAQLEDAVRVDDPTITTAQRFLLRELAAVDDPSATRTLIDVASDPRASPDLVADARTALAKRRNGQTFMEQALERHFDFLKDVLSEPPVGPIAVALGAMKERAAAPLLAAHLLDPNDTPDDVKQTAAALAVVGGPDELLAMRQFFGMYRASAEDDDVAAAVVSIAEALLASADKGARAEVEVAANDSRTVPYTRDRLVQMLAAAQLDAGPAPSVAR